MYVNPQIGGKVRRRRGVRAGDDDAPPFAEMALDLFDLRAGTRELRELRALRWTLPQSPVPPRRGAGAGRSPRRGSAAR